MPCQPSHATGDVTQCTMGEEGDVRMSGMLLKKFWSLLYHMDGREDREDQGVLKI